jgi:hypothetical protein
MEPGIVRSPGGPGTWAMQPGGEPIGVLALVDVKAADPLAKTLWGIGKGPAVACRRVVVLPWHPPEPKGRDSQPDHRSLTRGGAHVSSVAALTTRPDDSQAPALWRC